jgi:hypothetical protein
MTYHSKPALNAKSPIDAMEVGTSTVVCRAAMRWTGVVGTRPGWGE